MNRRKILAFALGPVAAAALRFLSLPLIAWLFPPEDIGRNNVFQVFGSFCTMIFVLGLDQAYVREFHEAEDRFRLFKSCFMPGFILLTLVFIATLPFSGDLAELLYGESVPLWYVISAACILLSFIATFLALVVRMQERGLAYSAFQVLPKLVTISLLGSYMVFGAQRIYTNLLYANLVSTLLMVLVLVWNTRADCRLSAIAKINATELKKLLQFGAPLVGAGVAYWGLTATSTIALRMFSGFKELGVYSMGMSLAGVGLVFQAIFSTVWMPTVYKWVAEGRDIDRIDTITDHVFVTACFIFALVGMFSWAVDYILPPDYANVKYIIACCIAQPLLYTLSETTVVGLNIQRKTMYALGISIISLLANAVLSVLLVPHFGAAGAAVSNAVAFVVFFIARTEASSLLWRPIRRKRIYILVCSLVLLSALVACAGPAAGALYGSTVWAMVFLVLAVAFRGKVTLLLREFREART